MHTSRVSSEFARFGRPCSIRPAGNMAPGQHDVLGRALELEASPTRIPVVRPDERVSPTWARHNAASYGNSGFVTQAFHGIEASLEHTFVDANDDWTAPICGM